MIELVWFAAGVVATAGVVWLRARLRTRSTGRDSPPPAPAPIGPGPIAVGARRLARTIGSELANLVSGVEGRAHNLIYSGHTPRARGMHAWHDLVDWIGGYPFEVAKPETVFHRLQDRGFSLENLVTCGGGIGCTEFLFRRRGPAARSVAG